ncbi:MAG: acyl-CoA thioesterase [Calditerrivibrio nitroreducens]|uniref:Acyl-CoA thioesterase n=2 Tax=Calditerrivibrionaceae TaxID=2945021 RepID=A0A2J6WGS4_9BACT|nr:MAG: acyl-CoA thioesterase [Calditerrivibrio nitroreducens]
MLIFSHKKIIDKIIFSFYLFSMKEMSFSGEIEVRYSDLDAYGHVNHATYFTYLETVRTKVFLDEFNELITQGIYLIIVSASCDFKHPIHLGDKVIVSFNLKELKRTSFTLTYSIHNGSGLEYATAQTTLVSYDNNRKKAVPLPDLILSKFS